MTDVKLLVGNPLLGPLLIVMVIHVLSGVIAAIRHKEFSFAKLPNFMLHGTLFLIFLMIMDYIYDSVAVTDMSYIVTDSIYIIRGGSWLAVIGYYISQTYGHFVKIGMPRLISLEPEMDKYSKPTTTLSNLPSAPASPSQVEQEYVPADDDQGN